MSRRRRVVVVGDVMTDVVVRHGGPVEPGSDTPSTISVAPGGAATNQAYWLARAGAEVHLFGAIGDDEPGRAAQAAIAAASVIAHLVRLEAPTGVVVSLVDASGQRSMLTDRGANLLLSPEHLASAPLEEKDHLHLSGYVLLDEATRPAGLFALSLAERAGASRSVDAGSAAPLARAGAEPFLSWASGADLLFANGHEAAVLTGCDDPDLAVAALARHFAQVVVTLGPGGARYRSGRTSASVEAPAVEVLDTTGAGDAFCATFLAARLAGNTPHDSLAAGAARASTVVGRAGARPWR